MTPKPQSWPTPRVRISNYCWAEHPATAARCTEPAGHPPRDGNGGHYNPYTKTSW